MQILLKHFKSTAHDVAEWFTVQSTINQSIPQKIDKVEYKLKLNISVFHDKMLVEKKQLYPESFFVCVGH